jgi:phospholipid transport system substrate-binding protein
MNEIPFLKRSIFILAALALCFTLAASGVNAGEATNRVKAGIDSVLKILRDPNLKMDGQKSVRRAKLRSAIEKQFDFKEMSRRSLARQWRKRTPKERIEFVDLFSGLMEKNYIGKIETYTDEVIRYTKEEIDEEYAKVRTVIVTKRKREIPITYRLHKVDGVWRVYDVSVKGISLINTYRQQFRSIIRRSSYAELVKILRRKRDEG